MMTNLQTLIESAWTDRTLLQKNKTKKAIVSIIDLLDKGQLRVAEPTTKGWRVNEWIKKAVVMYFPIRKMETIQVGPFEFHDKIPNLFQIMKNIKVVIEFSNIYTIIDARIRLAEFWLAKT